MAKRLTKDQVEEIIKLYKEGKTPTELGERFGIYDNSVTRLLRKKGIDRTQLIRVSQDKIGQIISEYAAGVSSEIIGKKLDIDGSTVCRILKRNNIVLRPATQNKRSYKINEDYFEIIDTEEKAYLLGFMYADGNLSKGGSGIKICLQEEDRDILEKFSIPIYGFAKIYEEIKVKNGISRRYLTSAVYCEKMHKDLTKLGCPPKKTFIIRMPHKDIVPEHLLRHFIRGYFDGDGCICITNPIRPRVDFSSNALFIQDIIIYLESCGLRCNRMCLNEENPLSGSVQLSCIA